MRFDILKKIKIIHNPSSGRQNMERKISRLVKLLLDDGYIVGKFLTEKKDDATVETIKATKEDWDILVVCGGDGTLNEVVKGIILGDRKIPIAILSSGTVNDFANYMGIPKNINEFFQMIKRADITEVDIGKANDEYFINVAAGGMLTSVAYEARIETKMFLGRMAYYLEGLKELALNTIDPIKLRVESKEASFEDEVLLFLVSNSSSIGGFRNAAPTADVSDGLLDVVFIKKTEIHNLANIFFNVFSGDHVNHPDVKYFKTNHIKISSDNEVDIDVDGEFGGKLPVVFEVFPKAFKIII